MDLSEEFFARIERKCTVEQIKDLLRSIDAGVRADFKIVLGDTKAETIANLRRAFDKNVITNDDLLELLRSSEEYGNQYVFLFRTIIQGGAKELLSYENAVKYLFPDGGVAGRFPAFEETEDSLSWADFRRGENEGSWIAKFYAKRVYEKETRREKISDRSFCAYYVVQDDPIVAVVESDGKNGLEIRISKFDSESYRQKALWVSRIFEILGIEASPMDFLDLMKLGTCKKVKSPFARGETLLEAFSLSDVMRNLLTRQAENTSVYTPAAINFRDTENGTATFKPDQRADDLFAAVERQEAVSSYLDANATSRQLSVNIHSTSQNPLVRDVRVAIGGFFLNEFRTDRSLNSTEYSYIRNSIIAMFL